MIFDHAATVVAKEQLEHIQHLPAPGRVEHDPDELWTNTQLVVAGALRRAGADAADLAAVGITNQRETTVVWDRASGRPIAPAIVWQDTRTQSRCEQLSGLRANPARSLVAGAERYRERVGLPLAAYFSGPKIAWLLDEVDGARARAEAGELAFGTVDSWLIWNLTGGQLHVTDPTNASRTMLMDLDTLSWAEDIAAEMTVPLSMLPQIRSSSEVYATVRGGALDGVPIGGILGDQQAAMFGQACLAVGEAKSTYGTGNFVLLNTGTERVRSRNGLLSTVCYALDGQAPVYALEGSIAVTGALVQWLRDNLGLIDDAGDVEALARSVDDNGGAYIVPAFSGLFAPHWRPDARGAIVGLTRFVNRGHLARAVLEATAFQTREVVEAMNADSGVPLRTLKVDGGMVCNELLMQFQADILDVPVIRPAVAETTALGAAYAAGLAVGFWTSPDEIAANWTADRRWQPSMSADRRAQLYTGWQKAVTRTFDWV